jgi:hypothetical protein
VFKALTNDKSYITVGTYLFKALTFGPMSDGSYLFKALTFGPMSDGSYLFKALTFRLVSDSPDQGQAWLASMSRRRWHKKSPNQLFLSTALSAAAAAEKKLSL